MSIAVHSRHHRSSHIRRGRSDRWARFVAYVIVGLLGLICLYPLLLTVTVSLTPEDTISREGYRLIPSRWTLDTYIYIFAHSGNRILKSYIVTIIVTLVGTAGSMLVTCMISYAISLQEMRYRNVIAFICNFTSIFSAGLIPWYVVCANWYGLRNNILALILPAMFSVWNMFLMRTYFRAISPSLYDAAKIDGAGHMTIFFRIALPLSITALLTVGLMYALCYWNDWWHALMFIDNRDLFPLQYVLVNIEKNIQYLANNDMAMSANTNVLPSETMRMAIVVIAVVPIMFSYPFFQKYFISGLTIGAVKG